MEPRVTLRPQPQTIPRFRRNGAVITHENPRTTVLSANAEAFLQLLPIAAAQRKTFLIFQYHFELTLPARRKPLYAVQVHNGGAVNAAEQQWIQVVLKIRHAAPQ